MKRLIALLAIASLVAPVAASAEEPPAAAGTPQADVAIITKPGIPAPFPGVLYTFQLDAQNQVAKLQAQQRADDKLKLELGLQGAQLRYATATVTDALAALKSSTDERLKLKDARAVQLEKQLADAQDAARTSDLQRLMWLGGGVALCVLSGLAVHWAAGR